MTSPDVPDRPDATSSGDMCTVSNAVMLVKHQNKPVLDRSVMETKSEILPVNREQLSIPAVTSVDDVTSATTLCEMLLSRGLGDPALTTPLNTSSGQTADRGRYHSLPPPSTVLVRSVERVQTIPYLVDEIRRAAVGHAEDARRRTAKFIERIEAEQREAKAVAATAHLQLLAHLTETVQNREEPEPEAMEATPT